MFSCNRKKAILASGFPKQKRKSIFYGIVLKKTKLNSPSIYGIGRYIAGDGGVSVKN